ncbi:hypothetical protein C4K26_2440 [Pseudomonas chlororaphis]|nr:hypothetical protein C4K26_2440 [Pseudomonas chlororaphis]
MRRFSPQASPLSSLSPNASLWFFARYSRQRFFILGLG